MAGPVCRQRVPLEQACISHAGRSAGGEFRCGGRPGHRHCPPDSSHERIDTPDKLLYHPYLNISTVTDTVNAPVEID